MTTHRPNEHLGSRYTLISPINSGAMGEVWRARDVEGGLHAAKILRPGLGDNAEMVKRFVAERNLLLSVHHPNVVGVHDLVVEGDTLAIVMDLVEGRDLRQVLAAVGAFTPSDAALVCAELADGLAAIHEQRIVHRDMKPANVLVDEAGEAAVPRITDFGVSRLTETGPGATNPTLIAGTPHYMAPELLMNQTPTAASDLYSLGIMLYELTTGLTPFADRSPAAAMQAQLNLAPGRPDGIDERLWDAVRWLTRKDPSQRPATAAQTARALREVSARTESLPAMAPLVVPPAPVPTDAPSAPAPAAPS
ncbi:serine/threonine-protein kinase, partial [uncultured Propionibacterium sp.]|uniref:serine/threonine-protein kinase n=1 Tax=uncultured Propionibacterium sp. TaxID=218066 RepID=UPI00292E0A61